ncbi:hypothetical protein MMC28_001893 [Mycoblastus sanguinarius]|nr:hypothetical protein [Mycoblastus sanguinarius]
MPPLLPPSEDALSLLRRPLAFRFLLPSMHNAQPNSPSPDSPILPSRTIPDFSIHVRSLTSLFQRETTVTATANPIIPATYTGIDSGPTSGTVVGIVFGSVAGFLLLLWLIYTCFMGFGPTNVRSSIVEEEVTVRRRSRSPRRSPPRRAPSPPSSHSPSRHSVSHHSHHSASRHSRSEVIEVQSVRRERTPPRRESSRRETVIIEETRRPAPPREEPVDDIVEVIEEHSPVQSIRRETSVRESTRKKAASGYRTVDPEQFGGGDRPMRKLSRRAPDNAEKVIGEWATAMGSRSKYDDSLSEFSVAKEEELTKTVFYKDHRHSRYPTV